MRAVMQGVKGTAVTREEALRGYRVWLFGQGEENEGTRADRRPIRRGVAPEEVAVVEQVLHLLQELLELLI